MSPSEIEITVAKFAGLVAAVTAIIVAVRKTYCFIVSMSKFVDSINENTLYTLKLVIMSESMPLSERIKAGERYLELGGNGMVKCEYEKLLEEYKILHGA